jgi:predicted nicotinamide N-methyase
VETTVELVVVGPLRLELERPCSAEALIDEGAFGRDEFLPYWAELWPSGLALARHVATLDVRGLDVLELGCGLGLPSLAAAAGGARVLATDWARDALALLRRNATRNGLALEVALVDWREPGALEEGGFGVVLAADVLYEERNCAPLIACLERSLADDGRALVADPGRLHAPPFLDAIRSRGWRLEPPARAELTAGRVHVLRRG